MVRCYAEPEAWQNLPLTLSRRETHHLVHVLRLQPGDSLTVFDGRGREAEGTLKTVSNRLAVLDIGTARCVPEPRVGITLFQALPKAQRMDLVIQKATELRALRIFPIITARTVVNLKPDQFGSRRERWQRIALDAAKQCASAWIPEIANITAYPQAIQSCAALELPLIASLEDDVQSIRSVLRSTVAQPRTIGCIIGPEGDLSPEETAAAINAGIVPVNLGSSVLRTETAALYVLSVLNYEFDVLARSQNVP